jgi:hypothetical protein
MVRGVFQAPVHGQDGAARGLNRVHYETIATGLRGLGLIARGGFHPEAADGVPGNPVVLVMIGNAGPAMWPVFARERTPGPDAMNRWSRRHIDAVAAQLGARALYPFDGPPWYPFQRWAQRAEPVFPSPIGMLIHAEHGLWHAYRGALAFDCAIEGLPEQGDVTSPCESCADKPCLSTCPVAAFDGRAYDVPTCAAHLRRPEGADCLDLGCRARRACPVGRDAIYLPEQAAFHMAAFLGSREP